jgi:hypothetical protein
MVLKLKENFGMTPIMVNLMEDDMVMALKLFMFAFNTRKKKCDVLNGFFSFLMKYENKKSNMICYF